MYYKEKARLIDEAKTNFVRAMREQYDDIRKDYERAVSEGYGDDLLDRYFEGVGLGMNLAVIEMTEGRENLWSA